MYTHLSYGLIIHLHSQVWQKKFQIRFAVITRLNHVTRIACLSHVTSITVNLKEKTASCYVAKYEERQ